ncbi:Endonuclease/exonuclease/phosphatase [Neurospora tetraspora]|uniref:Endonuclease/exonuclease/phosphatase n=1 Tax=Neurospora tetraspora TaxID=94610 RepID=A0AAE0J8L5_9PEZI|nr:Endonuclease/exonuclease/phosphatase [Neurospora tetraspora]
MKFTSTTLIAQGALAAAAATSGDFTILSMNVAGLPAILNPNGVPGGKEASAKTIGSKFAQYGYDVIHMQEDFNYHATSTQPTLTPSRTPTSGGVPLGSGLNTLSNLPWLPGSFQRQKWNKSSCASEFDCLTPKGFTFMRVALSGAAADGSTDGKGNEVYVDFYKLHTDAGTEKGDLEARNDNLRQVKEKRLTDTWIELHRDGVLPSDGGVCGHPAENATCEIVDKVLYRSSPLVKLEPTGFEYAGLKFLSDDGNVLSDYNPVLVNLTWSAGDRLRQSEFWGGATYGSWFNDVSILDSTPEPIKARKITFRGESRLDSVALTISYSSGQGTTELVHGGRGGSEVSLTLADGEFWTKSELCQSEKSDKTRNFYIKATTSKGRTLEAGTRTSEYKVFEAEEGWQVVGFLGEIGDEVDLLGFIYGKI